MPNKSGKAHGIKFDGEMLCIYLFRHRKIYKAWPKFQCMTMDCEKECWNYSTYGQIYLSSGLIGIFDGLDALLPRLSEAPDVLKMLSPMAISAQKNGKYYVWDSEDARSLSEWYYENKENIRNACGGFINTIPLDVRKEAGSFINGYIAGNHWFLIKQAQLYKPFIELMRTNPALAYTFAHRKVLGLKTKRLGRNDTELLLAGKHREITHFLGFSNSKVVARILKKIPPAACIRHRIKNFLDRLNRRELWKTMQHLEIIDEPVLDFYVSMVNYPKNFLPRKSFIEDIVSRFRNHDELWTECFLPLYNIFRYLDDEAHDFESFEQMRNKYANVIDILRRQELPARERKYPKPPFQESDFIKPIVNRRELFEEGFDQKNCIYSYDDRIIAGRYYVYCVLAPERATVSLRRESNGRGHKKVWRIEEIKTRANNRPSWETIEMVNKWFEQVAVQKRRIQMFLKEFPILPANSEGNFDKFWTEIPRKLYKTLEVLSRSEIPNSKYSMGDLEGLMKSLILRQSQPGQFIVVGGSWTLIGVDDGAPSDVRVELVFFPTYMVVSLMTLFWYRYPERAKRLKGFREALHEGLNFTSMRRLFGHGMEGGEQRIQALNILKMGDVFRYVVEHVDEHPKCRDLYNVLIDCKLDIDKQYYRVSQEIRSLHKSLSILPNKVLWKTSEHFIWRAQYSETTDCLVIVEAPYTAPPKAEIHTDTIVNNLALSLNVACIVGRYSKKYYRHTTFRNRADDFMVREYRRALKEILNDAGALDESEKAVKKVLHLVIRGLADRHGVDVEISTRNNRSCRENISNWVLKTFKRALNMETGPWKRFTAQKDQLFSGGSPYLEVNRKGEAGDETFAGFGENYNTMEIRIRKSTRKTYLELIIDAMGELIENYRNSWSYKE